jgi:quinol monooxygenase YgiN
MAIVLIARFVLNVKPDKRGEFLSAVAGIIDRTLRLPGCLSCRLSSDCHDPDGYFLTSEWKGHTEFEAFEHSTELQVLCGMRVLLNAEPRAVVDDVRKRTERALPRHAGDAPLLNP